MRYCRLHWHVLWLLASKTAVAEADVDCPLKFEAILLAIAPGPSSQSQGKPEGNERHLLFEQHQSSGEPTAAATKTKNPPKYILCRTVFLQRVL